LNHKGKFLFVLPFDAPPVFLGSLVIAIGLGGSIQFYITGDFGPMDLRERLSG
jgi:hypothetical protein